LDGFGVLGVVLFVFASESVFVSMSNYAGDGATEKNIENDGKIYKTPFWLKTAMALS